MNLWRQIKSPFPKHAVGAEQPCAALSMMMCPVLGSVTIHQRKTHSVKPAH